MALMQIPGHDRDTIHPDSIIALVDLDLDAMFTIPADYVFIGGEPIDRSETADPRAAVMVEFLDAFGLGQLVDPVL